MLQKLAASQIRQPENPREHFLSLSIELLTASENLLNFILACNSDALLSERVNSKFEASKDKPELLAKDFVNHIFTTDNPVIFLRRCVRRQEEIEKIPEYERSALYDDVLRLLEILAPVSFYINHEKIKGQFLQNRAFISVDAGERDDTFCQLAFALGVPVDLQKRQGLGESKLIKCPEVPEQGMFPSEGQTIDLIALGVCRTIGVPENIELIKNALKTEAEKGRYYYIASPYPHQHSDLIKRTFPELILAVMEGVEDLRASSLTIIHDTARHFDTLKMEALRRSFR